MLPIKTQCFPLQHHASHSRMLVYAVIIHGLINQTIELFSLNVLSSVHSAKTQSVFRTAVQYSFLV